MMCPLFKRNLRRFEQRRALVQPACCAGRRQTLPLRPADNTCSHLPGRCSRTAQRWRPFLHKTAACTSIYIGRRWQSTRKNPYMNRPLCLLLLVLSGCGVPQDTASVVEITAAKPASVETPDTKGKQGGPPSKQPPATDTRKKVAASDSDENRNHNPEGMPQERQTTDHPHILETLGEPKDA